MIDIPVGVSLALIGLLALVALVRSLKTGTLAVFFTKRPDIVRAEEPLRFWTQFASVGVVALIALFVASILLT
ncbi:hypothetical protein [Caulobacter sp. NIBR1757]|uniref:hypothetical protein n=1 Tax=Caulobacter sp. NIBR1757 TaxID=3016000 RepID=UPI0022F03BC9|nr:hypothetical protein [Caulobacter sp. NIBR1757]WGM40874.1 hypothetical protein AMEJIAPC_03821 [Caulobacter sp. NIBR1757]